jgi:hypothetical protein
VRAFRSPGGTLVEEGLSLSGAALAGVEDRHQAGLASQRAPTMLCIKQRVKLALLYFPGCLVRSNLEGGRW